MKKKSKSNIKKLREFVKHKQSILLGTSAAVGVGLASTSCSDSNPNVPITDDYKKQNIVFSASLLLTDLNLENYFENQDSTGIRLFKEDLDSNFVGAFSSRFSLTANQSLFLTSMASDVKQMIKNITDNLYNAMITQGWDSLDEVILNLDGSPLPAPEATDTVLVDSTATDSLGNEYGWRWIERDNGGGGFGYRGNAADCCGDDDEETEDGGS